MHLRGRSGNVSVGDRMEIETMQADKTQQASSRKRPRDGSARRSVSLAGNASSPRQPRVPQHASAAYRVARTDVPAIDAGTAEQPRSRLRRALQPWANVQRLYVTAILG